MGSVLYDRSGNNNHGTITGATWERSPGGLWGLKLDGSDDYVQLASNITLNVNSVIMFWAKFSPNLTGANFPKLIGRNTQSGYDYLQFGLNDTDDNRWFNKLRGETSTNGDYIDVSFSSPLSADVWYHIGITQTAEQKWQLYRNAVYQGISSARANPALNFNRIGATQTTSGSFYGDIHHFTTIQTSANPAGDITNQYQNTRKFFGV